MDIFCNFCSTAQEQAQFTFQTYPSNISQTPVSKSNKFNFTQVNKNIVCQKVAKSNYLKLIKEFQNKSKMFSDSTFVPSDKIIGLQLKKQLKSLVWKRIHQFIPYPKFIDEKFNPADVLSSDIEDSYFLSTISSIAEGVSRIKRLFGQLEINKNGIYMVKINLNGIPREVVLDDYFPVTEQNIPIFSKPKGGNQIWVMLIEKTWAKLSLSYENAITGFPHEVLKTFTSAPCFYYNISTHQEDQIWKLLIEANQKKYPICAGSMSNIQNCGILRNHTYSVITCIQIELSNQVHRILKIRNPWIKSYYRQEYSQYDKIFWNKIDKQTKEQLGFYNARYQKVFFIGLPQFIKYYEAIDISHINDNYSYNFEEAPIIDKHGAYFEVEINSPTQCYFTIHQDSRRSQIHRLKKIKYAKMSLLIAKKQKDTIEYINSKLQMHLPDVSIHCPKLTKGKYIIYARCQFLQKKDQIVLSTYSKNIVEITKISRQQYPNFLEQVFYTHSLRNPEKTLLGNKNDWICIKELYHEGGFGYIAVHLDQASNKRVMIEFQQKQFIKSGYRLKKGSYKIVENKIFIQAGQTIILVCLVITNNHNELVFPPPINISQTIIQK